MSHDFSPVEGARIRVLDRPKDIYTWRTGEYWRLLLPGTYEIEVSAKGFVTQRQQIHVVKDSVLKKNFFLPRFDKNSALQRSISSFTLYFCVLFACFLFPNL